MPLKSVFPCPDWVKEAVFYQIFPDRFSRSNAYNPPGVFKEWMSPPTQEGICAGNLRGIIERLAYIKNLGCNALYLCPIFVSNSNHRYHTIDYFRIDPVLGTDDDFDELVRKCRKHKIRIILDGVFNHSARGFFQFNSLLEQGKDSPYKDWFFVDSFPLSAYSGKPNYRCWWDIPALPKFNTANKDVREMLMRVGEFWVRRGIDGWRLDVPNEIDDDSFWQEFRMRVKAINPEAYIVGEIWESPERWLQGDQFDGVMNYPVRRILLEYFFPKAMSDPKNRSTGEPDLVWNHHSEEGVERFCEALQAAFSKNLFGVSMTLVGSHDTVRLASIAEDHEDVLKLLWAVFLFLPGAVSIYYGDELGMKGGKDPDNRRCFPWDEIGKALENPLYRKIWSLISLRNEEKALRYGNLIVTPEGGGVCISRTFKKEAVELRVAYPGEIVLSDENHYGKPILAHQTDEKTVFTSKIIPKGGFLVTKKA